MREVLFRMERSGVLIDAALLEAQSRELGQKMMELETQGLREAGQPFNLNSPKQIGEIFFERLQLPVLKKTPSGAPSTDEEVLERARARLPAAQDPARIPRAHQAQIHLHRQAAAHGQPRYRARAHQLRPGDRGDRAPGLNRPQSAEHSGAHARRPAHPRGVHRAGRAACIVSADYSQIELRIMAHISRDENLLRAFARGRGRAPRHRRGNFRPQPARSHAGRAPLRQGDQLRPDLRHVRVRRGAGTWAWSAPPPRPTSTVISPATPAWRATWSRRANRRASSGYRRNGVRPPAVAARNPCRQQRPAAGRRARRDQRADAGHGGGSDQALHDRRTGLARPRGGCRRR